MPPTVDDRLAEANEARIALDYGRAKELYEAVLVEDGGSARALHGLGFVLMFGFGEFADGLRLMERAAERAPGDQAILLDLAKSYAMLGEDEKPKALFARVVALNPDSKEGQEARKQLVYYE